MTVCKDIHSLHTKFTEWLMYGHDTTKKKGFRIICLLCKRNVQLGTDGDSQHLKMVDIHQSLSQGQ